jgi:hypothetical protein
MARSGCANFVLGSRTVKVSMRPNPAWPIKSGSMMGANSALRSLTKPSLASSAHVTQRALRPSHLNAGADASSHICKGKRLQKLTLKPVVVVRLCRLQQLFSRAASYAGTGMLRYSW